MSSISHTLDYMDYAIWYMQVGLKLGKSADLRGTFNSKQVWNKAWKYFVVIGTYFCLDSLNVYIKNYPIKRVLQPFAA